jgi:hypothetical protein
MKPASNQRYGNLLYPIHGLNNTCLRLIEILPFHKRFYDLYPRLQKSRT